MSGLLTRRRLITGSAVGVAGVAGLAAATKLAAHYDLIPPDHGGLWGASRTLTYAAQRLLLSGQPMAREFGRSEISKTMSVNGPPPETEIYLRHKANSFADYKLVVDGLVARPGKFSVAELKRFPMRSQITGQTCEKGWSYIAEWHGLPLAYLLNFAGISAQAKYVVFYAFDTTWDSLDLPEALHPQTQLSYGLNGMDLPVDHGAPLRLRVPRQLGYKSTKYLTRIFVTDSLKKVGNGLGSNHPEHGYSWFAGI
jgi:DMSO/TMAO reductase YedYZ molybdopterin-dependent catalytic subunit